ncbi:metallo-beta-lactamase family protein [Acidisarcina polymorpha]|uniref:Metallo-beta-lactamase family protein n=1 Tax=Acidisarcina polymorpha TaxID=2211140 RepID=A0A2Z5FTU4_9BACT|nr:MBL fold metallo-hydrolase [Acidisarcina polymorpha]AXC10269.1 metallo-beta-lactamase family protein [Acidisarcina polymorpha]
MDRVPVPTDQIVPMDAIAPGVHGLRIAFVNVFSVEHNDGSWTLIDAAIPFSETQIRHWVERNYRTAPNCIVLTHGHFDHVSAARGLADHWMIPIYAHPLEFPYLTGKREYAAPNAGAGGGLMSLLSPIYPRGPIDLSERLRELKPTIAEMPGWEMLHTPGHTPGHISLFRAADKTLLVGDAFCTTKPESFFEVALAQPPELHGPPAYFTSDWNAARRSVEKLASLAPITVAPGHGRPLCGPGVAGELREMAMRFDQVGIPENRKAS